jgi:hypothetical protein
MRTKMTLALGLIALLAVGSGLTGQSAARTLKAKIGFEFTVGGKVLPMGDYEFVVTGDGQVVRVQGQGKAVEMANVITRLAGEMHTTPQDAHLVFDVVGTNHMLSEIWIPGEDGYLVHSTKGVHTHKVVNIGH